MSEHHGENLTVAEFFEEYGMVVFFGSFFLMTMFLPLLFMDLPNKVWLYAGFSLTMLIATSLLVVPALTKKRS